MRRGRSRARPRRERQDAPACRPRERRGRRPRQSPAVTCRRARHRHRDDAAPIRRSASGERENTRPVVGGDGFGDGDGSLRNRSNGSAISSVGVRTSARLSRNTVTRTRTFRRNATPRAASVKLAASHRLAKRRDTVRRAGAGQPADIGSRRDDRVAQRGHVAPLGRQPRPLEKRPRGCRAAAAGSARTAAAPRRRRSRRRRVRFPRPARIARAVRRDPGRRRAEGARCPAPAGRATSRAAPAAARGRSIRLQRRGPVDRLGRRVELAESQVGKSEIRPRRGLARCERRRLRELPLRIVEQADLELREAAVEAGRRLFIGRRAGGWKAGVGAPDDEQYGRAAATSAIARFPPPRPTRAHAIRLVDVVAHRLDGGPDRDNGNEGHPDDVERDRVGPYSGGAPWR